MRIRSALHTYLVFYPASDKRRTFCLAAFCLHTATIPDELGLHSFFYLLLTAWTLEFALACELCLPGFVYAHRVTEESFALLFNILAHGFITFYKAFTCSRTVPER